MSHKLKGSVYEMEWIKMRLLHVVSIKEIVAADAGRMESVGSAELVETAVVTWVSKSGVYIEPAPLPALLVR